jgi:hypothetical protein
MVASPPIESSPPGEPPSVVPSPPAQETPIERAGGRPPAPGDKTIPDPELGVNPLRKGLVRPPTGHEEGDDAGSRQPKRDAVAPSAGQSDSKHADSEHESDEPPFDPIEENGTIFDDWPPPKLALVITGRLDGYLEPCGCAGIERMKGGLSRRHSMLEYLRNERGWPVVAVDAGGLVKGFGPQAEIKFQFTLIGFKDNMQYNAIAVGRSDLTFGGDMLLYTGIADDGPFVSANVAPFGFDRRFVSQQRIVEVCVKCGKQVPGHLGPGDPCPHCGNTPGSEETADEKGGVKVGITSVLGKKWQEEITDKDVALAPPEEKLAEVVPSLRQACDVMVLLAHATMEESLALARQFPEFDVVVTAGGHPEPPEKARTVEGTNVKLIEVGQQSMYAIVLGFYDDPAHPVRDQRVPLDSRFPSSSDMKRLMTDYQDQLKNRIQSEGLEEGLAIRTLPLPDKDLTGGFIGSAKCQSCHEPSYDVWKKSGHAKGWRTLVKLDPPRNFDPECISCHVVGWSPQNYRPLESGFSSQEETPHLINVGCETCHGPGEAHANAEAGSDADLQERLRKAVKITIEESKAAVDTAVSDKQPCRNCHDGENSPGFDFGTYWSKIEHPE